MVITGAGSGLGSFIARDLFAHGASLILLGRRLNNLQKIKKELSRAGGVKQKVVIFACDIRDEHSVRGVVSQCTDFSPEIFGLVNNAGINPSRTTLSQTQEDDFDSTIETNLKGSYLMTRALLPIMIANGSGSIVNISSIAGIVAMRDRFPYSVSKSALIGFTKSISADYAKQNIRANCICPGYVRTPLTEAYLDSQTKKSVGTSLLEKHPLGGLGKGEDIANAVTFFISNKSSWITGSVLPVDGGYSLGRD